MPRYRIVVVLALCVVLGYATRSYAGCTGSTEITGAREQQLRAMLSDDQSAFHVLSETTDRNGKWRFVLYLSSTAVDQTNGKSAFIAVLDGNKAEKVVFTFDVNRFLEQLESQLKTPSQYPMQRATQQKQTVDGCLNSFQLPEHIQGLHLNLFMEKPQLEISGATDILFAIREDNSIQPVLELNKTSLVRSRASRKTAHQDSTIWLRQTDGNAAEVIWEQFDRTGVGILTSESSQNTAYRWEEAGFRRVGTLEPDQLAEHLKGAVALTRCGTIIPLRFKVEELRPNQPAP